MDALVLFKVYDPITVIARETELKKFWRNWKIRLIGKNNLDRVDLDPGRPWILGSTRILGSTPGVARK